MCTVILVHRHLPDTPLLLAANRDEQLDRPAAGPALVEDGPLRVVAPRDLQAGGTWLGINADGVVAAITNRFGAPPDPARRSRGDLVFEALRAPTVAQAAARIEALDAAHYNPFHLLIASAEDARVVWSDGENLHHVVPTAPIFVLTERSFDAAPTAREAFLRERLEALRASGALTRDALRELLSVHRPGELDCTCIRVEELNYGTRSSTILSVEPPLLLHADGPPCERAYDDLSELLHAL